MTELDRLGKRHKALLAELEQLKPKLHDAMREERARLGDNGKPIVSQNEIRERSGYKTVQQVRVILGEVVRAK